MTHLENDFAVQPRVVCTTVPTRVRLYPTEAYPPLDPLATHRIRILPLEYSLEPRDKGGDAYPFLDILPDGQGRLEFVHVFSDEQTYVLRLFRLPDLTTPVIDLSLYAVEADLFALRPLRGDLHVHTNRSDGKEPPTLVAANYREAGFDFLSITDHGQRNPSIEAMQAIQDAPTGLVILPGEEVHPPDNHLHIVQIGGTPGLAAVFSSEPERYLAETAAIKERLSSSLPQNIDTDEFASCCWCCREIALQGGMSILPHPYWRSDLYHMPLPIALQLLRMSVFDAFEVLGGLNPFENHLQISLYHEVRSEGHRIPVVGSSDSHGTIEGEWFDWVSTLVFAPDASFEEVRKAILEERSVAVESYPGLMVRAYGPFRLVRFAHYLLEFYFPWHHTLCREEGRLLKALLEGDEAVREDLSRAARNTADFRESFFGGGNYDG